MQQVWRQVGVLLIILLLTGAAVTRVLAASYTITIDETKFVPSTIKVKTGDSITFINTTDATQSAKTTSSLGFNTGDIGPGQNKSVTVDNAGTYTYTSAYNSAITGTMTVEGSSSSTTTSTESATTTTTTTTKGGQDMPVSGTTEVLMALIGGGLGLIGFGVVSNRYGYLLTRSAASDGANQEGVLKVDTISSHNRDQD